MRYRDLPDYVVWPLVHALLLVYFLGGIAIALSPRFAWLSFLVAGVGAWMLMARYYSGRHDGIAGVFSGRGLAERPPMSRWAAALPIGLFGIAGIAWLAAVGLDPRLPASMSLWEAASRFAIVITAPINEEVIFRGVLLYGLIACGCRPWVALVWQAGLFTLAHGFEHATLFHVSTRFLGGIVYGLAALHFGALWQGLAIHVGWNVIDQLRGILSGSAIPGAPAATAWHTGLPPLVCIVLSVLLLVLLNRRYAVWQRLAEVSRPRPRDPSAAHPSMDPPTAPT